MATQTRSKSKNKIVIGIIVCVIAAMIISIIAIAKANSRPPQAAYDFGKEVACGIDVSEHNKKIDWKKVKKNVDYAFIRVGYRGYGNGKICLDKTAKANLEGASRAGIPFGVYFYSQAINEKEAREEAQFLMKSIRKYNPQLPLIIDFEYPTDDEGYETGRLANALLSPEENTAIVNAFCDEVTDKGYLAGVYCSSSVAYNELVLKSIPRSTTLWIADYNSTVTYKVNYDIWQYSCTGKCDGVQSKYVDLSYWYDSRR